jgi:RHS repeat-associated protein
MMRRQRSIVVFLLVMLSTAVHGLAQSVYDPPPAPPRKTPTPIPEAIGGVQRPRALSFGSDGESGTYTYDGSGNITAIGSDTFLYDLEGRLVTAVVRGVTGSYTYDAFGNRKTATGETNCSGQTVCATPLTLDSHTNRLLTTTINNATTDVTYDAAGNITSASGGNYSYDGTDMMTEATVGSDDRQFVYTADDERIAVRQGQSWTWTVRGLDNKVLREFTSTEPNTSPGLPTPGGQWIKDYIWRDGLLLASTDTTGTYHYHLDHLGTPRLITNASGAKVAEHAYYPFGSEISLTPHESSEEAMKFTGHERDTVVGDGHTLDDMHARYYSGSFGRFVSPDPELGNLSNPQSWNRYTYVLNNPVGLIDPDGRADDGPKLDDIQLVYDPNDHLGLFNGVELAPAGAGGPGDLKCSHCDQAALRAGEKQGIISGAILDIAIITAIESPSIYSLFLSNPGLAQRLAEAAAGFIGPPSPIGAAESSLLREGQAAYNEELTVAGRALTKHPEVLGFVSTSALQAELRTPAAINGAAANVLESIVKNGARSTQQLPRFGAVTQIQIPGGFGARWSATTNKFIGFINP